MPCCESDLRGFVCHSVCSQISSNICPSRATRASPSSFVVVVPRVARRASRARAHHFKSALHVELSGASSRALAPSFDISRRVAQCRPRCPEPCFAHRASRAGRPPPPPPPRPPPRPPGPPAGPPPPRAGRARARARRARARRARTFAEPEKSSEGEYGLNPLTGEPLEAKGQLTAIVTGVVSVALALGYLALVQVMDSREMVAPPEEAFGDGSVRPADERARRGE